MNDAETNATEFPICKNSTTISNFKRQPNIVTNRKLGQYSKWKSFLGFIVLVNKSQTY